MTQKKELDFSTEKKILDAAREVFSEKGYDGASIGEIARRAEVNKALPYYYFENKQKILERIVRRDMEVLEDLRSIVYRSPRTLTQEAIEDFYEQMLGWLKGGREMVRIMMQEALAGQDRRLPFFHLMDEAFKDFKPKLEKLGGNAGEEMDILLDSFFFCSIPIFMFVALGEEWAEHHGYDKGVVQERFMNAFKKIYISYNYKTFFSDENKGINI